MNFLNKILEACWIILSEPAAYALKPNAVGYVRILVAGHSIFLSMIVLLELQSNFSLRLLSSCRLCGSL
jgi:hypothetical protein